MIAGAVGLNSWPSMKLAIARKTPALVAEETVFQRTLKPPKFYADFKGVVSVGPKHIVGN